MRQETVTAALLGHAVGDALGVPVELSLRNRLAENPVTDMRGYGAHNQPLGTWSGDTSLTIATMASISRCGKVDYEDIMRNFVDWYSGGLFTAGGETFDCDPTTAKAIENFLKGARPRDSGISDEYSNENGSLMRMLPAAVYVYSRPKNLDTDMRTVHNISALTHAHPRTWIACGIYAFIAWEIFDGKNLHDAIAAGLSRARDFYKTITKFSVELPRYDSLFQSDFAALPEDKIVSRVYIVDNLKAALWCLLNTDNFRAAVLKAVNLGGDTDTVGAICGGLAGAAYGLEQIPAEWLAVLRKKDYLEKIATDFYNALAKERI